MQVRGRWKKVEASLFSIPSPSHSCGSDDSIAICRILRFGATIFTGGLLL